MQDALTLEQLVATYQRRYDDALLGDLVNARQVYERLLGELHQLTRRELPLAYINTAHAARLLGLSPKTVVHYCEQGKLPGVQKSGDSGGGRWLIPAASVEWFHRTRTA